MMSPFRKIATETLLHCKSSSSTVELTSVQLIHSINRRGNLVSMSNSYHKYSKPCPSAKKQLVYNFISLLFWFFDFSLAILFFNPFFFVSSCPRLRISGEQPCFAKNGPFTDRLDLIKKNVKVQTKPSFLPNSSEKNSTLGWTKRNFWHCCNLRNYIPIAYWRVMNRPYLSDYEIDKVYLIIR